MTRYLLVEMLAAPLYLSSRKMDTDKVNYDNDKSDRDGDMLRNMSSQELAGWRPLLLEKWPGDNITKQQARALDPGPMQLGGQDHPPRQLRPPRDTLTRIQDISRNEGCCVHQGCRLSGFQLPNETSRLRWGGDTFGHIDQPWLPKDCGYTLPAQLCRSRSAPAKLGVVLRANFFSIVWDFLAFGGKQRR